MKKIKLTLLGLIAIILVSCSGSDVYRGAWKATDSQGAKYELNFDAKVFSVTDSSGEIESFNYTQNSVNIKNSVSTYGIQLSDGRVFQITFPIPSNQNKGLMKDENGVPVFAIGRNDYIAYDELYNLK